MPERRQRGGQAARAGVPPRHQRPHRQGQHRRRGAPAAPAARRLQPASSARSRPAKQVGRQQGHRLQSGARHRRHPGAGPQPPSHSAAGAARDQPPRRNGSCHGASEAVCAASTATSATSAAGGGHPAQQVAAPAGKQCRQQQRQHPTHPGEHRAHRGHSTRRMLAAPALRRLAGAAAGVAELRYSRRPAASRCRLRPFPRRCAAQRLTSLET